VDGMKPTVGMSFDSIYDVEEFYKEYAHEGGFSVHIGSQNMLFGEIVNKMFLCSKNGFKKKEEEANDPSKKRKSQVDTRCGCDAHIYVKLGTDKYYISSMVEQHNHILCSPNKAPFL
jgi:zinc finger SWIM domain-containing protein 3